MEYDEAGAQHMFLNDQDVTAELRTPISATTPPKSRPQPLVREVLLDLQRNLAATRNVVMDGRDIGTVVLPKAGREDLPHGLAGGSGPAPPAGNAGEGRQKGYV